MARYESRFLSAVDPVRPRGLWIRHTTAAVPGERPVHALWCTVFDPEPYAVKQSGAPDGSLEHGRAEAAGRSAAWSLAVAGAEPPFRHLSPAALYRAPLPRTKLEAPRPDAVASGVVRVDGRRLEVAGWRATIGHNWGPEHAARWVWVHAWLEGAWLELAIARVRVSPRRGRLSPWVAGGVVSLDGTRARLGGLARRPRVRAGVGALDAAVAGAGVRVTLAVRSVPGRTVGFRYADPGGGAPKDVLHTAGAEVHLRVERGRRPPLELAAPHGAAYELGGPEPGHGVPIEPFPDP